MTREALWAQMPDDDRVDLLAAAFDATEDPRLPSAVDLVIPTRSPGSAGTLRGTAQQEAPDGQHQG